MTRLEELINDKADPNAGAGQTGVQNNWEQIKLWRPRRSIYGSWLWPGQTVWRYTHWELCFTNRDASGRGGMYRRWFHLYLTDEEYVMTKLEN